MYISEFWCGWIALGLVEIILVLILAIRAELKKKKGG